MDLEETVSTFWFEDGALVGVYAAYAALACLVISGVELRKQASSVPYARFFTKALVLTLAAVVLASLWMYLTSWQSRLLGGEVVTAAAVGAAWYAALYALNASLCRASAISLPRARFHAHLPVVVLLLPCLLGFAFMFALGSAYSI